MTNRKNIVTTFLWFMVNSVENNDKTEIKCGNKKKNKE